MEIPIEAICSLGVGGVFGLAVFLMYRIDKKSTEDRITKIVERDQEIINRDQVTREANTKALIKLNMTLTKLNGRIK